ncbi:SapC family protein [Streptomyces luteolifulvus]|uniref:SapC family protein n=1 Tax=Streptomyces luteolifulvus TaxID=2615112 RepID=A0A6H9UQ10_9ACTN|nr:SapC family protein [Streptomyces luteolifulvus]
MVRHGDAADPDFTKELLRLGLLKQETLTVTGADGASVALGEYWVVDEERLQSFSLGDPSPT